MLSRRRAIASSLPFLLVACTPSFPLQTGSDAGGPIDATADGPHDASAPPMDVGAPSDAGDAGVIAEASSDADAGVVADGGILQDLVLLLHFEEPSWTPDAGGTVIDSSGTGNNGTPLGTAMTTPNGKFGRAAAFDGNGAVLVPDSPSLHPTNALTYAAWIYPTYLDDAGARYPGIIAKRVDYTTDVAFTMFLWTNYNVWGDIEAPNRFNSNAVFTTGQWYHVAIVYDGTQPNPNARATVYVNGAFDSTHAAPTSLMMHTADLKVGYLQQGAADPDPNAGFIGSIDEVAVWTRALSAAEIQSLYTATGPL